MTFTPKNKLLLRLNSLRSSPGQTTNISVSVGIYNIANFGKLAIESSDSIYRRGIKKEITLSPIMLHRMLRAEKSI